MNSVAPKMALRALYPPASAFLVARIYRPGPSGRVKDGFFVVIVFCFVLFLAYDVDLTLKNPQS